MGRALHPMHRNRKPMAGNSYGANDLYDARVASAMQGKVHLVFTFADIDASRAR